MGVAQAATGIRVYHRGPETDPGADGGQRAGTGRVDGDRHPAGGALGSLPAAVQLLQAAVRSGYQPADRSDSRRAGDLGPDYHRVRAEPVRGITAALPPTPPATAAPHQRGVGED